MTGILGLRNSCGLMSRDVSPRGLSWPDKSRWYGWLKFMLVFYLLFFPVYFGTQYLVSPERHALQLFFDWETRIPLIPWMIWPYLTLFTLFSVPLVQMTSDEMHRLTLQSTIPLLTAGVCFVVIPSRIGFPPTEIDELHRPVFDLLWAVDNPRNLVPSLHIAFSTLILLGSRQVTIAPLRPFYLAWLIVMVCAVILVHQHHIIDVVTGIAVAMIARAVFLLQPIQTFRRSDTEPC
jgi:membrane-associated phospholipid phosphatase